MEFSLKVKHEINHFDFFFIIFRLVANSWNPDWGDQGKMLHVNNIFTEYDI